jgi:hypothetical protein
VGLNVIVKLSFLSSTLVIEEVENIEFKLTSIVYSKIDSTANMPKTNIIYWK